MIDPGTLRGRLTLTYALATLVALIAFAALAVAVVDRAQRSALDAQLATSARAGLALVAPGDEGGVGIDETDRRQFAAILGAKANGALLAPDGRVLVASGDVPAAVLALAVRVGEQRWTTVRVGREDARTYVAPLVSGGVPVAAVAVWRDIDGIAALDRSVALAFAFAIPLFLAVAVATGAAVARRGLAPLDRIATVASEIEAHDLSRRLALPPRRDELGRLAATFDRMLDRLQGAFERQRRFTGDASHELRAPLSVIRAEADLALRRERAPAEYRAALGTILVEADALEALTRDLLAAARADEPSAHRREPVDLRILAANVAERLARLASARGIAVTTEGAAEVVVTGDRAALERAVVTVAHNAIRFARSRVELRAGRDDGALQLAVRDDGPGFGPEELAHALERFWRGDDARAEEGTGLGLAIADAAVRAAGGTIALENAPEGGALVRLRFRDDGPGSR